MSTIHVEHRHSLTAEDALQRAHTFVQEVGDKLKANITWTGPTARFTGPGFSGTARVEAALITLDLDLSLLLRPMKGKIEERIQRSMAKRFT